MGKNTTPPLDQPRSRPSRSRSARFSAATEPTYSPEMTGPLTSSIRHLLAARRVGSRGRVRRLIPTPRLLRSSADEVCAFVSASGAGYMSVDAPER